MELVTLSLDISDFKQRSEQFILSVHSWVFQNANVMLIAFPLLIGIDL